MSVRLAVDIGGTFTDATLIDEETGARRDRQGAHDAGRPVRRASWPRSSARSPRARPTPASVRFVVHATTVATNAIIEGKIARSGFVTTDGFRDMLEIARQVRPTLYDIAVREAGAARAARPRLRRRRAARRRRARC